MRYRNIILLVLYLRLVRAQDYPVGNEPEPKPEGGDDAPEGEGGEGGEAGEEKEPEDPDATAPVTSDEDRNSHLPLHGESTEAKDNYTFVALIDIVFTDGCRRTCTGAIIHDNVVITAAHCFTMMKNLFLQPELSLSFIVIGTKHMFETGYEHYLPIERVVTHPRFKGWTADLALVFTFANMMTDRPGTILPLASDKSTTPVDSNVTVLSWGRCRVDQDELDDINPTEEVENFDEDKTQGEEVIHVRTEIEHKHGAVSAHPPHLFTLDYVKKKDLSNHQFPMRKRNKPLHFKKQTFRANSEMSRYINKANGKIDASKQIQQVNKRVKVLPLQTNDPDLTGPSVLNKKRRTLHEIATEITFHEEPQWPGNGRRFIRYTESYHHFHNWRRDIARQHNNLTVGIFGYVNLGACKKIVQKTLPPPYEIKNKYEVLCYSSEEFYITNEDSGAPVVQGDELVAVTVGGVDSEGEHVAVGIRVSCFCTWIAENLPNEGGKYLKCGRSCYRNGKKKGKTGKDEEKTTLEPQKIAMRAANRGHKQTYLAKKHIDPAALAIQQGLHRFVNADDDVIQNYTDKGSKEKEEMVKNDEEETHNTSKSGYRHSLVSSLD